VALSKKTTNYWKLYSSGLFHGADQEPLIGCARLYTYENDCLVYPETKKILVSYLKRWFPDLRRNRQ
jgi:hypothetical protein